MALRLFNGFGKWGNLAVGLATGAVVFNDQFLYNVPAGHRGVVFNLYNGVNLEAKTEGTHFKIPILHRVSFLDVRRQPRTTSTTTGTKDLQTVNVSLRLLFHPMPERAPTLVKDYGMDYMQRVMPVSDEVLKSTLAQYNADQLMSLREQISSEIREILTKRCEQFHIVLDDVSLTHLSFSREFALAIEDKQIQEQKAERAKFVVARAEQEKKAVVISAEADAEAAHIVSKAIKQHGRGILEIRRLETALELAEKLSQNDNVSYLPSSGNGGNKMLLQLKA